MADLDSAVSSLSLWIFEESWSGSGECLVDSGAGGGGALVLAVFFGTCFLSTILLTSLVLSCAMLWWATFSCVLNLRVTADAKVL